MLRQLGLFMWSSLLLLLLLWHGYIADMVKFGAATPRLRERGKRPAGRKRARQPSSSRLILAETNVPLFYSVSCVIVRVRASGCVSQKRRPCSLHLCSGGGGFPFYLVLRLVQPTTHHQLRANGTRRRARCVVSWTVEGGFAASHRGNFRSNVISDRA